MYSKVIFILSVLLFLFILILACPPPSDGGSNNGNGKNPGNGDDFTTRVEGNITVVDPSIWDRLKLGVLQDDLLSISDEYNGISRLHYFDQVDGSTVDINHLGLNWEIQGVDDSTRDYYIDFPESPNEDDYYFVAWYDDNTDDQLMLVDTLWDSTNDIALGEFSRFPTKQVDATCYTVEYFWYTEVEGDPPFGYIGYKYFGMPGSYNGRLSDDNENFNFIIDATTGF